MSQDRSQDVVPQARRLKARIGMLLGSLCVVAISLIVRYYWGAESANADSSSPTATHRVIPTPASRPTTGPTTRPTSGRSTSTASPVATTSSRSKIVAVVNGEEITRDQLGRECLRHYGEEVLETLVNKYLISQECKQRNIIVTQADVDAEIKRMAQRFSLPTEQWLKMLKSERGISPEQYAGDIIWPMLALRRLAGDKLTVTQDELVKAYETKYGPAVDARLIACTDPDKAKEVHGKLAAHPEDFGKLAKAYSIDSASASVGGRIQPIRMHGSYPEIEQAAFNMADGEISQVIPAGGQYVILQRERELPGVKAVNFQQVAPQLEQIIRDGKMRRVASEVFHTLQDRAQVVNVMNDPAKSRAMPGVAALVNGQKVTIAHLTEQCISRHGTETLEGTINRQLIEQACRKHHITVTDADLDAEITRAAATSVPPKADGSPDVEAWLKLVTEKQGVSIDVYRHDAVWPSVALKKLTNGKVEVTDEDLRSGYEANYGPRVRCRAIVMNDLRRAQRVWTMARDNRTAEYFGELASQYSMESSSRALRGEMPPLRKHGGQPLLEKEAFALKAGEISGIIQVGEQFVILYCEGFTTPTEVAFDTVRQYIFDDVYEKKQRLAMAEYFQQLQDTAFIDNYLAGTSHTPKKAVSMNPPVNIPSLHEVSNR